MHKVLIYGCDGVLGDTEQHGHLPAFNRMWRELGVPWEWSVEEYGRKLKTGGGKERMGSLFAEPDFLKVFTPPDDEQARRERIALWHNRRSAIYKEILNSGRIPPRPGVRRLAEETLESLSAGEQRAVIGAARARLAAKGPHYIIDATEDLIPIVDEISARIVRGERS